jgi:hypothetical protein
MRVFSGRSKNKGAMMTDSHKLVAFVLAIATGLVLACGASAFASPQSDASTLIAQTTAAVEKSSAGGSEPVHVTKIALTEAYAIVDWTQGRASGEKLYQQRYGVGWRLLGGAAAGWTSPSSLAVYDVPTATATALLAAMKQCASPQTVRYHGQSTSVCFIGPCTVCQR